MVRRLSVSSPAPDRAALKWVAASGVLVIGALAVWLNYPDKTFVFDGIMFSQIVDRSLSEWRRELMNPRHLLFNVFFQLLRDGLQSIGLTVNAYRLFQQANAVAGIAGLLLFCDLSRRLSRDFALGWCAALLLGATLCYGTRATEGQVYMLMSLGAIAFLWSGVYLFEKPTAGRAALLIGTVLLGALFHAADAFLFPAAALTLCLAFPKRRFLALAGAATGPILLIVAYLFAFGRISLREFLSKATDFHVVSGSGFWSGLFSMFWSREGITLWDRLTGVWRETGYALTPMTESASLAAGLGLWIVAGVGLFRAWPRLDASRRAQAALLGTAWAGFVIVNAFWRGGVFFYVPDLSCAIGILALSAGPYWIAMTARARRGLFGSLTLLGLGLALWNIRVGLKPQSSIENNTGYRPAMFVGAHTEPTSWIIISGVGFPNSKVYLPKFAHRRRQVLEYFFNQNPKDTALRELSEFSKGIALHGIPMYLLSDLVESPGAFPMMTKLFGVSREDVYDAFGPGRAMLVAAGPEERVYLYVPRDHRPELFVCLGYSVLTGDDQLQLAESVTAITAIAREMSPTERRRAAELMSTKNWGFDLILDGFSAMMNAESRAENKMLAQRFADYQQTAAFWMRAGNLYAILGQKAQTLDAWTRAQKLSGDVDLLKRIRELRKS